MIDGGVFVFAWASIGIVVFGRWIGGREAASSVPDSLLSDYQITRREAEILRVLILGRTAGQIGGAIHLAADGRGAPS